MELTDPTDATCEPTRFWSTANIGEATPDVLSPMCWSFWGPTMEAGGRLAYFDLGILDRSETAVPQGADNLMTAHFRGRPAMNLDLLRAWFDAMPGMTADDFERDICGTVRDGLPPTPGRGRTLAIARKAPVALATTHRAVHRAAAANEAWWTAAVLDGDGTDPLRLLLDANDRFREAFRVHVRARLLLMSVQAQLTGLAEKAGRPELVIEVLSGLGGVAETAVADDLWSVGRGQLTIDQFVRRHGFHGPNEGNLTAVVWREDPGELEKIAVAMASRPEAERPRTREAANIASRQQAVDHLAAAVPAARRPVVRLLARMAVRCVQALEVGKASFLRTLDGGRAATRQLGAQLAAAGILEDPEDAMYLTIDEHRAGITAEHRALVAHRRACRERHRTVELPSTFTGTPVGIEVAAEVDTSDDVIEGVPGAPGIVEGTARLVLDPNTAAPLEPGEILVCRFTDPSWAPMFTLADALVIDIGASASHGAIVARELGVPCVVGTNDGTRRIRTGDWLRVDGSAGRVDVLKRAGAA